MGSESNIKVDILLKIKKEYFILLGGTAAGIMHAQKLEI